MPTSITPLKLDKSVPLSSYRSNRGQVKTTILAMKVGDSFVYPRNKQSTISVAAKRYNVELTTRRISEDQIRVWRVA